MAYPGFVTEKIVDAFLGKTVPIFWGDPMIERTFNKNAFIDASNFPTLEELVDYIAKVEQDDELYLTYLTADKFAYPGEYDALTQGVKRFVLEIFAQKPQEAFRRPRQYASVWREGELLREHNTVGRLHKTVVYKFYSRIKSWRRK